MFALWAYSVPTHRKATSPYLLRPHLFGVALPVKEDEAPDPIGIRLLGAQGKVAHPGDGAHAFEEFRLLHGLGVSGGKVLKALAGGGIIHAPGRSGIGKMRLLQPHYVVRPNHSAFATPLRS